ncbi:hypothetical protein AB6813_04880 [bacterium RCC_150]
MSEPVYEFMSHIQGKNAKVRVYPDRIEWERNRLLGMGKASTDMIPMKHITGLTTKRDGLINSKVSVITSGDTIEFRVSHTDAANVKEAISRLILA